MSLPESKNDDLRATWFGRVGQNWKVVRAKNAFRLVSKKVGDRSGEYDLLSLTLKGIIPRDIESGKGKFPESFDTYQEVKKSDIVFCLFDVDETPRTVGLSSLDGMVTGAYTVVRCTKLVDPRFVTYFYLSIDERKGLRPFYTGLRKVVRTETFLNAAFPLPDLPTQRAIADFLDRETARIDTLIEKKQRLVELLGEKVKAKITQTVRGAREASRKRLRHVASLNPSTKEIRIAKSEMVTFCAMDSIQDGIGGLDPSISRQLSDVISGSYNYFAEGDVLLAKVTPCFENGKKALAKNLQNGIGFATSEVFVIRPDREKLSAEYLIYLLSSEEFQYAGRASMTGAGGLKRISEKSIMDFPLLVENLNEQNSIVSEIDKFVSTSTKISSAANKSIDHLKEYRSALITSAVTGQIDVTKWTNAGTTDRQLDAIEEEFGA